VVRRASGLHVVPEFLGNRAPFADPHARAIIAGLGVETDFDSLVALYVAGLCGIGYGLRQIIEAQAENGAPVERIMISGGAGQHDLARQVLADATGTPVVATVSEEPVLLGSAMLGAVAGGLFDTLPEAMAAMSSPRVTFAPATGPAREIHEARYDAFRRLQETARIIRRPAPGSGPKEA
jgi:D-ribulokinase